MRSIQEDAVLQDRAPHSQSAYPKICQAPARRERIIAHGAATPPQRPSISAGEKRHDSLEKLSRALGVDPMPRIWDVGDAGIRKEAHDCRMVLGPNIRRVRAADEQGRAGI